VDRAVRGAEVVIHCGAAMKGGWIEHNCATVTGTRNVLESCKRHGVKKLVHISSMSVIDWAGADPSKPISEDTAYEPRPEERGAYTRAKLEAERLVVDYARNHNLPCVILRPGQIFGERLPLLTPAVARKMGKRWLVLGNGRVQLPLVYIQDVVHAIMLATRSELSRGEIVQLVDPEKLTQNDVLRMVLGKEARITRMPRPLIFALGKFSELLLGLLHRQSPLGVYRLQSALACRDFESLHAARLLRWEPQVGVCEGIRMAAREMRGS
jgi:nucleoside-diphosphate-sugar epimerase